jgi:hypothetical protein
MGCIIGKPVDCSGSEHQGGIPVDIPERDWGYLKLFEERERDCLKYEPLDAREPYADVKLKRVDVFRLWSEGPSPGVNIESANRATRQPQRERARRALAVLFPAGIPDAAELPNSHLDKRVNEWLKAQGQPELNQRTIRRAANRG